MSEEQNKKPVGVSFSFSSSKKADANKLGVSKLRDDSLRESREETDFIHDVQDKKINGSVKKEKKKELVIPLITKNRWRLPGTGEANETNDPPVNLEEQAAREIMEETQKMTDGWENRGNGVPSNVEIPLFMQNRVPTGFETDEKIDVSLRAEQSTLDDYETIPVEAYGMAMLRGMGWKESEGIGLTRKGVAATVTVTVRPKGLGLGADRSVLEKAAKAVAQAKEVDETLKVAIGAYVQLLSGKHQGLYGQIESMDANSGRALVRMAVGGNEVDISELFLKPVNAKEYRDSSRVLNKEKYDKYKSKQEKERQEEEERKKSHKKKRKHSRSRSRSRSRERSERKKESKSKKHLKESKRDERPSNSWLFPLLRVRCIDSNGQYFKQKLVVIDVISKTHCICRTENGKLLDNISISKLETVVPRTDPGYVMVVSGRRKGQVCELIERDKERCMATVQTLPDRDDVFHIDYDSICEYTGDVRNM